MDFNEYVASSSAEEENQLDFVSVASGQSSSKPADSGFNDFLENYERYQSKPKEGPTEPDPGFLDYLGAVPDTVGSLLSAMAYEIPASLQAAGNWMLTGDVEMAKAGQEEWRREAYQPRTQGGQAVTEGIGSIYEWLADSTEATLGPEVRVGTEIGMGLLPVVGAFRPHVSKGPRKPSKAKMEVADDIRVGAERVAGAEGRGPVAANAAAKQARLDMAEAAEVGKGKIHGKIASSLDAVLNNINKLHLVKLPQIAAGMQQMEAKVFATIGKWSKRVTDPLSEMEARLDPNQLKRWTRATLKEDDALIKSTAKELWGDDALKVIREYKSMRNEFARRLKKTVGEKWKKIAEYYPRMIKDWDGLIEAMKQDPRYKGILGDANKIQELWKKGEIGEAEAATKISKILMGGGRGKVTPQKSQAWYERSFKRVPEKYMDYFASPSEAMNKYLHETSRALAEHEFLGRAPTAEGGMPELIAEYLHKHESSGLASEQMQVLTDVIGNRFGPETYMSPPKWVQNMKTSSYMVTIADYYSALTQLSDLYGNLADYGLRETMRGMRDRTLKAKDLGVRDIQHEMAEHSKGLTGHAQGVLDKALKISLFKKMDFFGKDARLSAAYHRFTRMANTKPNKVYLKYRKMGFNDADAQAYVKAWKSGDPKNPRLVEAALIELMRRQPLSPSQQAAFFNAHPIVRLAYVLKTWSIQQLNGVITDILTGNKGNAAKYTGSLGLGIASIDLVKLMLDKAFSGEDLEEEEVSNKMLDAVFKAAMPLFSRYDVDTLGTRGTETFLGKLVMPPIIPTMWNTAMEAWNAVTGDEVNVGKVVRSVPVVGDTAEELMKR